MTTHSWSLSDYTECDTSAFDNSERAFIWVTMLWKQFAAPAAKTSSEAGWMLGSEEQVIPEMNNNFNHCQDTSYLANFLLSVAY